MPHHDKNTANTPPNRPTTRPKNATAHPGIDAQKVLSTRRDPEVIEKEKLERKAKKEAKERQNADEAARKEDVQHRVQQLRAQQIDDGEAETHQQPKGKKVPGLGAGHGKVKASSSETVKAATSTGNRGSKRKTDLMEQDHDEHPPAKKGKAQPAAEQRTRPVPRPVQKNTQRLQVEVTMSPVNHCNTKKRPSEAADLTHENDPKTPVPLKKAKIAPIRRTETMIELDGSNVVTRRPTGIDLEETGSERKADDEEATPRAQTEDVDTEPYQTPVGLTPANQKNKTRVMAEPEDTPSDVEIVGRRLLVPQARDKYIDNTPLSSRRSSAAPKSLKSRTTVLNEVAAARPSDGPTSTSKAVTKTSKKSKIADGDEFGSLGDEDDTKEREAALSSPMKGKDFRQSTAAKVKVERGEEETLSANEKKKVKDDVIPHFIQRYASEIDCFAPLSEKDFRLLEDLYHRVMGRPLPYKLTKNSEVVKMISAKLSDYRTQFRIQADNNAKALFNVYFDGDTDAIQDNQKRMDFGLYYCMEDEYKFQFKGSERPVGKFKASGRFLSRIFLDTFSIHYRYALPKNPLPNWDTPIPVGGLALAAAAIDRALTLYRDDHYEYENGTLSIKQPPVSRAAIEKAMRNRATRGGSEGDNDKVPSTSKFHFSKGKYGNVVLAWHGAIIQKAKGNFADICAQARKIFGVADVGIGNDNQRAQNANPEVRTRVGLDSESESEEEGEANDGDDADHGGNSNSEDNWRNGDIDYHSNDGSNHDTDDGNSPNAGQNEAGLSRSELEVVDNLECYERAVDVEKNDGGEETEVVPGPSCLGGRRGTKSSRRK